VQNGVIQLKKIKNLIKKIISKFFKIKKIIIMESNPDFTDNTKKVYDKLLEKNVNEKYKIVWFVDDYKKFNHVQTKNVKFINLNPGKSIINILKKTYYLCSAKIIIDCNKFISKVKKQQIRIHLCHGTPLKKVDEYNSLIGDVDYILEIGNYFSNGLAETFKKPKDILLDFGFPRNDDLFANIEKLNDYKTKLNNKIVVWLPTYRNHKNKATHGDASLKYGLPCLNSKQDILKFDRILKDNNVTVFIKLHPAEDSKILKSFNCKNLKLISDKDLLDNNLNLYQLLSMSDALITDYSSVYYDYLLTKKPIALAISDIKLYEKNVGFFDDFYKVIKGEYAYNVDDLNKFIVNLSKGIDNFRDERLKCLKLYHSHYDDKASERVYEFIKKFL